MQGVVAGEGTGPDSLRLVELPRPVAGAGEVRIDVAAVGVNRADLLQRDGRYRVPDEVAGWPLGLEVSGTVGAVGPGVARYAVGDEVCALLQGGGYAEAVCVDERLVLPRPPSVSLTDAAGLPEVWATAYDALHRHASVAEGERVLIHGGASGLGTAAIQLVTSVGASAHATVGREEKADPCRGLGAAHVYDYRDDDVWSAIRDRLDGRRFNVVIDIVGARYLKHHVELLAVDGRLVVLALIGGKTAELDLAALLGRRLRIIGSTLRFRPSAYRYRLIADLQRDVWPGFDDGTFHPVVDAYFDLSDVAEAHAHLESGEHVGKVILTL